MKLWKRAGEASQIRSPEASATADDTTSSGYSTRRQWFAGAAGAAVGGAALVALRPTAAGAASTTTVDTLTNQTIAGTKTFIVPPVVPIGAFPTTAVAGLDLALAAKQPAIAIGTYLQPGDVVAPTSPGATATTRYVGGTTSGAPTTGAHLAGDYVIDRTGKVWICTLAGTPGTWTAAGAGSGAASPLALTTSVDEVPLSISRPLPTASKDILQVVGIERNPGAGNYRTVINRNGGIVTNAAILINADIWTGANRDVPPTMAQGRPLCLGIVSDIAGPTIYQRSNGVGAYEEWQNTNEQVVWNAIVAPNSGGSGIFLGIGDDPISTLTLSDVHDPGNLTALTLRHGTASARIGILGTGYLDISNNFNPGENTVGEYALQLSPMGAFVYGALLPGGPRKEVLFVSSSVSRLNTTSFSINYLDGVTLLMAYEPGSGNMRFRTTSTGGGAGVFCIGDAAVIPNATPDGGGVLYSQGGALKWKGSSGTVTTIAAA